jgi:hypothetical protein
LGSVNACTLPEFFIGIVLAMDCETQKKIVL